MKRLLLTTILLNVLFVALLLPHYPQMPWLAAEALLISGLFALLPESTGKRVGAATVGALFGLLAFFALSDVLVRHSIGRPFNLYLELGLAGSVFNLLQSNLGMTLSLTLIVMALAVFVGLGICVSRLLRQVDANRSRAPATAVAALGIVAMGVAFLPQPFVGLTAARAATQQVELAADTYQSTASFQQHLMDNPGASQSRPLQALAQTDVILGFIESYGISSVTDPRYGRLIQPRLQQMEQVLANAGLHMVTGRLQSPVQGGQSWLAHTTLLSGQWIDTQLDYDTFLASDYPTLIDDMGATGHDSVAVMPAITREWPEGLAFGYNRIYHSTSMGYRGPALNWVTMPDQYTWSWFQRQIRERANHTPVFAEVALISSHAPWVPILPVLDDWDSIGDGEIFNRWKDAGEAPASLWRDPERVRDHYARSLDYALNVATEYAKRHVDNKTLLVLTGDHQAAPLITGDNASRDVVVHVISADPTMLAPFVGSGDQEGLRGFRWGAHPHSGQPGPSMASFRPFLHRTFSGPHIPVKVSASGFIKQ